MNALKIVEILIISFIVIRQIVLFIQSLSRIKRLKDMDLHTIEVILTPLSNSSIRACSDEFISNAVSLARRDIEKENDHQYNNSIITIPLLFSENNISETAQIIKELNRYIVKNDGQTVNFLIIQDIVERNYQVLDDEINQTMPTPLYLGLAATMLGIIFGLVGMSIDDADIMSLIQGVGIAMISSFIGLSLTTILSTYFYKRSKTEAEKEKNLFFSKLQAELLPDLLRQGVSGIEGLSRQLKNFAKNTIESTDKLVAISDQTTSTLTRQNELIKRIDSLNINELSSSSLLIFEKLEKNLASFEQFSNHWEALIKSISQTGQMISHLELLVTKISNVDHLAEGIQKSIDEYKTTMHFFTKHISSFERLEESAVAAVQKCDIGVATAVDNLLKNIHDRMNKFNDHNTTIDIELKDAGVALRESLHIATRTQLELLAKVYSENIPAFDHLNILPNIEAAAVSISKNINEQSPVSNDELMKRFEKLERVALGISDRLSSLQIQGNQENRSNGAHYNEITPRKKSKLELVELWLRIGAASAIVGFALFNLIGYIIKL
jgi:hypothetical protein